MLDDLWRRLDATRWPDDGPGGFALSDARALAAYWRDGYDWRAAEDELLGFSNVEVDGLHAIVEGDGPPLLLLHGWPSTVWEFHRVIPALREHFRLVVPSLPGYGWSVGMGRFGTREMGDAFHRLMASLGHERYLVAGGDWGAHIGSYMGHAYPDAVRALHLNMMPLRLPDSFPDSASAAREALEHWSREEGGYIQIMGTKPQTLAYGLFDSPVGLMSWIAEKFESWTDARGVSRDDLLTTVMILDHRVDRHLVLALPRAPARRLRARSGRRRRRADPRAADVPRLPEGDDPRPPGGRRAGVHGHRALGGAGLRRALPGVGSARRARRQPGALQPIDMTLSSLAPRGVSSFTVCPTRAPRSALPTGESIDSRPSPGEASEGDTSS